LDEVHVKHRLASPWTRLDDPLIASINGRPKHYRNVRRALGTIEAELGVDLVSHDFRRSLASFLIIAGRTDEGAVTGVMGHANIATTRRAYAADGRDAEERNELVLRGLADAGIGQRAASDDQDDDHARERRPPGIRNPPRLRGFLPWSEPDSNRRPPGCDNAARSFAEVRAACSSALTCSQFGQVLSVQ
jgi:Phage integrase family